MEKSNEPKRFALNMSAAQFVKFYIMFLLTTRITMYSEQFKKEFKTLGGQWSPAPSTLLNTLAQMTEDGFLTREVHIKGKRQRLYLYQLTHAGKEEFDVLKKKYYNIFDEQRNILEKVMKQVYK
ncbi:PadR family transcriptional regulator [Cytobacillus sp. IB215665]|uniref:PadR family transcriptional regulator n=1 Tax=Cytobacillus sp. IB215665 TaxID=3097357 RepID=UPI002A141550|nr:PadR family transcriptional regulator [Cytobacillus sp. IB215665]MDX8367153.1 PadR family transcriptional regulator [Cytobacillus sp. IB215665]